MDKIQMNEQTKSAFDFVEKLYSECAYIVKEIEGLLYEEDERFIIGRPSGYSVSSRRSTGLDPQLIIFWMMRSLSVFFVEEEKTTSQKGQTITNLSDYPKVIYLRVVFDDTDLDQPSLQIGVLSDIKGVHKSIQKFEHLMGQITYSEWRIFGNLPKVDYQDNYAMIKGHLNSHNLFDINSSEDIQEIVIKPVLKLYRE